MQQMCQIVRCTIAIIMEKITSKTILTYLIINILVFILYCNGTVLHFDISRKNTKFKLAGNRYDDLELK